MFCGWQAEVLTSEDLSQLTDHPGETKNLFFARLTIFENMTMFSY